MSVQCHGVRRLCRSTTTRRRLCLNHVQAMRHIFVGAAQGGPLCAPDAHLRGCLGGALSHLQELLMCRAALRMCYAQRAPHGGPAAPPGWR